MYCIFLPSIFVGFLQALLLEENQMIEDINNGIIMFPQLKLNSLTDTLVCQSNSWWLLIKNHRYNQNYINLFQVFLETEWKNIDQTMG